MAYVKKTNLRGPQGPAGPSATTEQIFDKAWPIGAILETNSPAAPPIYNTSWKKLPNIMGRGFLWQRIG